MRRVLLVTLLVPLSVAVLGLELSVLGGMELGGRGRPYIGARVGTLSAGLSLMLEAYYPLSSFEAAGEIRFEDIKVLEIDPFLYLGIPIGKTLLYVGAAPILVFNVDTFEFALYSAELFHVKIGTRFGEGLVFLVEGMTTLNTSFQTLGVYAITLGVGIGF